tara:strand:+ start:657 stop:914 length:258 start_codon:yes stop_codon:yes gene_type:complete
MTLLAILATFFGVVGAIGFYLQAFKVFKRKSSADVSIPSFIIFSLGMFFWLLYGIELRDSPLLIANTVGLVGGLLVISGSLYYRN